MQIEELTLESWKTATAVQRATEAVGDGADFLFDLAQAVADRGLAGGLLVAAGVGALYGAVTWQEYRRRRAEEARYTGEGFSMRTLVAYPPKRKAHRRNVAAPAVVVVREEKPWKTFCSVAGVWHTAGRDYDEPHGVLVGRTGHGKNDSHLDPMAANVVLHRPESAVILDAKAAMLEAIAERTPGEQFVYTCLPEHCISSALNVIATPEMATLTAAALYPTEHERQPFFNQSAAALFYGVCEYLGFGESNIVEARKVLFDRSKLDKLAKENESVHAVMEGEHKKSADEVVGTALLHLEPLRHPEVARMFDAPPGTPEPWFLRKETVWLCAHEPRLVGRLFGAFVHNFEARARAGRRGTHFLIDEAGSVLTPQGIERCFQVGRGYRTYFMIALQDLSQLIGKIGRHPVYSILGNAPLKIFGASDDPETRQYFSALSGSVQIRRRVYEDDGAARAWKQAFSSTGAPYTVREEARRGVEGEHLQALPRGSWMIYTGDPHGIELLTSPPFSGWMARATPGCVDVTLAGVPQRPDPERRSGNLPEPASSPAALEDHPEDELRGSRTCPACDLPVSSAARFCEGCGGRL